jgi:two-component system response regulator FixJ
MIIDDDPGSRLSLQAILSSYGYMTRVFAGCEEFLAQASWPDVGCVICDYRMPGMNGLELLLELRRRRLRYPAILVSGFADVPVTVAAMRRGAVTVLEKPYHVRNLIRAVEEGLGRCRQLWQESEQIRHARELMNRLDDNELATLKLMIAGVSNKMAALQLGIGLRTLERRRQCVFAKLRVDTAVELADIARLASLPDQADYTKDAANHENRS